MLQKQRVDYRDAVCFVKESLCKAERSNLL